jgi:hypothetical protein
MVVVEVVGVGEDSMRDGEGGEREKEVIAGVIGSRRSSATAVVAAELWRDHTALRRRAMLVAAVGGDGAWGRRRGRRKCIWIVGS